MVLYLKVFYMISWLHCVTTIVTKNSKNFGKVYKLLVRMDSHSSQSHQC